jgi:ATP adenylyltransferase
MKMHDGIFGKLSNYLMARMRMSHIYQPVMIKELLRRGGEATVAEIAKALLAHDRSQVEYYEFRTKEMVGKVLTNNGIVAAKKNGRTITGYELVEAENLTAEQRSRLISACETAIDAFLDRRGGQIWSHRRLSSGYVSGTLRYEVLKRARFRCELCGISAEEKALEVDHIVPRNQAGSDDETNLQALCYSCNAMKRDRDNTDFRGINDLYLVRRPGCIFCELDDERILARNELAVLVRDGFPVTEGHSLIIPKRHVEDYFQLFQPELNAIQTLIRSARSDLLRHDAHIEGFNIGVNSGEAAGQTIFHCHIHLIPRRKGDVSNPRGGVRGVIPGMQAY